VFDQLQTFIYESYFFAQNEACQTLFDDFHLLFSKFFLYYYEDCLENLDSGRLFSSVKKNYLFDNMMESINRMAEVYQRHFEEHMNEEDKAQKEIEYSYIMLNIHKNKQVILQD